MDYIEQLNGLSLAYMGDAAYEVEIRAYLISTGIIKPNHLHRAAIRYVSAKAQANLISLLLAQPDFLSEQEQAIYKRGRNAKSHTIAKNADVITYRMATGFEALLGYLYLTGQKQRFDEIVSWCIEILGEA